MNTKSDNLHQYTSVGTVAAAAPNPISITECIKPLESPTDSISSTRLPLAIPCTDSFVGHQKPSTDVNINDQNRVFFPTATAAA